MGELYFWKGQVLEKRNETEEAFLNYHCASIDLKRLLEDLDIKEKVLSSKLKYSKQKKRYLFLKRKCTSRGIEKKVLCNILKRYKLIENTYFIKNKYFDIYESMLEDIRKKEIRINKLLCETYRKMSILMYNKQDYSYAQVADEKLFEMYIYNRNRYPDDRDQSQNGIDACFALYELYIMQFKEISKECDFYQEVLQFQGKEDKHEKKNNAHILCKFLMILNDWIEKKVKGKVDVSHSDLDKAFNEINDITSNILKIIDREEEDFNKTICLINYFYWSYDDIINWAERIRKEHEKDKKDEKEDNEKWVAKNAEKLILLAQKARDSQNQILHKIFAASAAITKEIEIYPQKISTYFEISGVKQGAILTIKDNNENVVKEISDINDGKSIDVGDLDEGTYTVSIRPYNEEIINKIIKIYKQK